MSKRMESVEKRSLFCLHPHRVATHTSSMMALRRRSILAIILPSLFLLSKMQIATLQLMQANFPPASGMTSKLTSFLVHHPSQVFDSEPQVASTETNKHPPEVAKTMEKLAQINPATKINTGFTYGDHNGDVRSYMKTFNHKEPSEKAMASFTDSKKYPDSGGTHHDVEYSDSGAVPTDTETYSNSNSITIPIGGGIKYTDDDKYSNDDDDSIKTMNYPDANSKPDNAEKHSNVVIEMKDAERFSDDENYKMTDIKKYSSLLADGLATNKLSSSESKTSGFLLKSKTDAALTNTKLLPIAVKSASTVPKISISNMWSVIDGKKANNKALDKPEMSTAHPTVSMNIPSFWQLEEPKGEKANRLGQMPVVLSTINTSITNNWNNSAFPSKMMKEQIHIPKHAFNHTEQLPETLVDYLRMEIEAGNSSNDEPDPLALKVAKETMALLNSGEQNYGYLTLMSLMGMMGGGGGGHGGKGKGGGCPIPLPIPLPVGGGFVNSPQTVSVPVSVPAPG